MTTDRLFDEDVDVTEAVIRVLEGAGIDMVFGIPGGYTVKLFDALYDHTSSVRTVLVREESLAGVMAEVYGRLTGKPAVVMGQGAFLLSNALLGTIEGHLASTPMLLLTDFTDGAPYSHHGPYQTGTGEWGAFDARRSFAGVTKETMVASDPAQAVQVTQLAVKHALTGRARPRRRHLSRQRAERRGWSQDATRSLPERALPSGGGRAGSRGQPSRPPPRRC